LDYNTKLAYIAAARQQAHQRPDQVKVLYLDEFTYYRRPSLARAYAECRSHLPLVRQGCTSNRQRRVVGTLDSQTGQVLVWQRRHLPVRVLLAFLRAVEASYPDAERIFIVMDNWPPHFHPTLLLALQNSKLVLLRLPTYAPWTNPIEKLWLRLNQELLHHHSFEDDWAALQQAVQHWFDQWSRPSDDLLHYVGLSPY
jgi:transposase